MRGAGHAPRYREGTEHFYALADLVPRVADPFPLLHHSRQAGVDIPADIDLGSAPQARSKRLWASLSDAQRERAAEIQNSFREAVARAFWEKVVHLDAIFLTDVLLIHPAVIHAIFGDDLPADWEDFCIAFTLKNTSIKGIWHLAKTHTYQEGHRNVA